jgi:hypothetical protein
MAAFVGHRCVGEICDENERVVRKATAFAAIFAQRVR